jgi:hypothetical protein
MSKKRDWDKERREKPVRERGSEPVGADGLPKNPRFGDLRVAAQLPRGRRERKRFSPHKAFQPSELNVSAVKIDQALEVEVEPYANTDSYRVSIHAANRSKLRDEEFPKGQLRLRLDYIPWQRAPLAINVGALRMEKHKVKLKKTKDFGTRQFLVAEGKVTLDRDGNLVHPNKARKRRQRN